MSRWWLTLRTLCDFRYAFTRAVDREIRRRLGHGDTPHHPTP